MERNSAQKYYLVSDLGCTVDIWYVSLRVGGSPDLVLDTDRPTMR